MEDSFGYKMACKMYIRGNAVKLLFMKPLRKIQKIKYCKVCNVTSRSVFAYYSSSLYGYSSGTCFKSFTCNSYASSPLSISRIQVTSVFIDT